MLTDENAKTQKLHVSFSELSVWKECSWRHRLQHIKGLGTEKIVIHFAFGKAIHSACEKYLRDRLDPEKTFYDEFDKLIKESKKTASEKNIIIEGFDDKTITSLKECGAAILKEVPEFLDKTFPDWEFVDAEHALFENVIGFDFSFKGYIDGIIKTNGKKGKPVYWIIDWKSCQWGWDRDKKSDELTRYQLIFYKNYWTQKMKINPKDVRCGFILLKKRGKVGDLCELVPVSVGDITTARAMKTLHNMITSTKKGIAIKNRNSCKWCEFKGTEHCT